MYKNAFVFGKMYPLTLGHKFLIDTALEKSEKVTLLICSIKSESIPGEIRFNWAKEIYKNENRITIKHCSEEVPQQPFDDIKNFWNIWVDIAKRYCPDIDVLFTSETYGDEYAKRLGIDHEMVDIGRIVVPICGTKVRNNPFKYWNFIPDEVKPYFVKRVAIMGPESTGKSILSQKLAIKFNTNFVEEYGRTVYEENNNILSLDDFIKISVGRQKIEDNMIKTSNKIIFCDTEDITTHYLSKEYFPNDFYIIDDWFKNKIDISEKYDLYILLKPDCEYIQDGTRSFGNRRWEHYNIIKNELSKRNLIFVEIGGDWENRFKESLKALENVYTKG